MKQKRPLEKKKKLYFFNFSKLPPKSCPGGHRLHPQRPQSVFEEDEAKEAAESFVKLLVRGQVNFFFNCLLQIEF